MNRLAAVVWEMQALLVVCPCCHQTFRLVEARLSFPARPAHASEYTRVLALESDAQVAMERATAAEQRLETWLATARRERTEAGRRAAKRMLAKIDPTFSGRKVDPQDVKLVFSPVEYVVFRGLTAQQVSAIELVSRAPRSRVDEKRVRALDDVVVAKAFAFEVLRMDDAGTMHLERAG